MTFQFVQEKDINVRSDGSICQLTIPKYMLVGLNWIPVDVKKDDVPIHIKVIPEFGEIVITHRKQTPNDLASFLVNAMLVPRKNPVADAMIEHDKFFNKSLWRPSEAEIKDNVEKLVQAKRAQLQQLDTMKRDYQKKINKITVREQEIRKDLKNLPPKKCTMKKYVDDEVQRMQSIAIIKSDKSKQNMITKEKYLKLQKRKDEVRKKYGHRKSVVKKWSTIEKEVDKEILKDKVKKAIAEEKKAQKQPIDSKSKKKNPVKKSKSSEKSTKKARK